MSTDKSRLLAALTHATEARAIRDQQLACEAEIEDIRAAHESGDAIYRGVALAKLDCETMLADNARRAACIARRCRELGVHFWGLDWREQCDEAIAEIREGHQAELAAYWSAVRAA